jgi:hypothetical protein
MSVPVLEEKWFQSWVKQRDPHSKEASYNNKENSLGWFRLKKFIKTNYKTVLTD